MKIIGAMLISLLSFCCVAEMAQQANTAFEKLQSLAGKWKKADGDAENFYIQFQTISGGSVLVENWMYRESLHS